MTHISVLGIDIAKQIFHVVGMDDTGRGATVCGQPSADRRVWPAATRERVSKKLVLDGRDGVFSGAWNPDNFIRPI
jgi:hypothetical protein